MSPVSTWSSMAVPASSDGRAADEGRSVLWRADFRHDHINGEACREGGGKMRFLPDVALRVTNTPCRFRQGVFLYGPNPSGAGPGRLLYFGEPMPVPDVRFFRYSGRIALSIAGGTPNGLCFRRCVLHLLFFYIERVALRDGRMPGDSDQCR